MSTADLVLRDFLRLRGLVDPELLTSSPLGLPSLEFSDLSMSSFDDLVSCPPSSIFTPVPGVVLLSLCCERFGCWHFWFCPPSTPVECLCSRERYMPCCKPMLFPFDFDLVSTNTIVTAAIVVIAITTVANTVIFSVQSRLSLSLPSSPRSLLLSLPLLSLHSSESSREPSLFFSSSVTPSKSESWFSVS